MSKVLNFEKREWAPNTRGYPHVICGNCNGDVFSIVTSEANGVTVFFMLICEKCGNKIPVDMTPVWPKTDGGTNMG